MADVFKDNLQEASFRGIAFPITNLKTATSFDIAQHKIPDTDGARIESTGRNPALFGFSIPCLNNLTPGFGESWHQPLYPNVWNDLRVALADRTTGIFQHPSQGAYSCKVVSFNSTIDAGRRDGEILEVELMEFFEDTSGDSPTFSNAPSAISAASTLDATLKSSPLGGFDPDVGVPSFEDSVRSIQRVFDTIGLLAMQQYGVINRVLYRLGALDFAITAARDATMWPARAAIITLRDALLNQKAKGLATTKDISIYITPGITTAGNLASKLANKVGDLVRLNPWLAAAPTVPAQSVVRYYAPT